MTNKPLLLTLAGCLVLCSSLFTSCKDDYEDIYQGYGMLDRTGDNSYLIRMDDRNILNSKESSALDNNLKDSMRLFVEYSIIDIRDSIFDVKLHRAQEILTKSPLPYNEDKLDSIGSDAIKITNYWMAYGFLNFEFVYTGGFPVPEVKHMVNLLYHPITDKTLELEFRHNAFNDRREQVVQGVVSFPIEQLMSRMEKPVTIKIKYNDSTSTSRTIEFTYR